MTPFQKREEELLKFWKENKIFEKSVEARDVKKSYVFYDGPPFATGLPHYGHIVASTIKDVVPRFWTMNGRRVERKWGWDCHGLPIENIVEQELKLNSRQDIEKMGVAKFNEVCESKVLMYVEEWKKIIERLGRWVEMENDYKTMDLHFMESVWWVFKSLWDKKLIYEGRKSMHICPRCETTLSNIEVAEGYRDVVDLSITAKFELVDQPGTFVLVWTTTPWTLPGNVVLAVGADVDYALVVEKADPDVKYIMAKALVPNVFGEEEFEIVSEFKGNALVGKSYKPLFDYFVRADMLNKENLYKIVTANFVSTDDGTGVVHIAPAFGEDDMLLGKEKNLPFIQHVLLNGKFVDEVKDWAGVEVKPKGDPMATDKMVIEHLQKQGLVFDSKEYTHSYPHCWRCDTPLLNYATSSWFIAVTKIKDDLLKQAKKIYWFPEHIKEGRFGKWLEGARDWAISRSRYWGNPMPVWKCACGEVIVVGSREELEKLSGQKIENLHKQFVDEIELQCPKCKARARRIPEVLDCWVESASMPYGQFHYPFENKEKFEENFPAEFIGEGVDQTRCWFYVLHILSTGLFKRPAFKNVIVNGTVLAEDGKKMSKRLNNYPDPVEIFDKYGADAMRFYLMNSPVVRAEDLCFSEKGVEEVYRKIVLILLNVLSFYKMYALDIKVERAIPKSKNILDQWILAKLNILIKETTEQMEKYNIADAERPIGDFINELSTWFVRRSRDRFKRADEKDKNDAIATLGFVLYKLSLVMAPFTPFLAEHVYLAMNVEDARESVHLEDWPGLRQCFGGQAIGKSQNEILEQMDLARKIVELALAAREELKIKVRQPLSILEYFLPNKKKLEKEIENIIAEEVNVKEIVASEKMNNKIGFKLKTDTIASVNLSEEIPAELQKEGLLRELVRQVNSLRKKQGLTISDRIVISYKTDSPAIKDLLADNEMLAKFKESVLASDVRQGDGGLEMKINDEIVAIRLA
ncbi:isoleucine--tRNA ligase [Candidatus Falkowbacteria bacterium]|nr:isoleucine--tRNA ligase [Candidatus Falkowbacteria bacterium]